jgi:RNA polymerase sigma-B factor
VPEQRHEEQRLFLDYRRTGDRRVREALVERYLPLACSLARRYARGGEPLEDLEQVASLALIKAVDGYDADRGSAFSSYAVPSIVGAIKRHYRDCGWSVRPPRELQELALQVRRLEDELSARHGLAADRWAGRRACGRRPRGRPRSTRGAPSTAVRVARPAPPRWRRS